VARLVLYNVMIILLLDFGAIKSALVVERVVRS
jgi:hypothetical protein